MVVGQSIPADIAALYGLRPVSEGGVVFCGTSEEQFAINGVTYQWPRGSHITWGMNFSRLGNLVHAEMKDAITEALKEISDCCDVTHEFVERADAANLLITTRRLDGQSGVLADCQIPVGNVSTQRTVLTMRLDDSENWGIWSNPPSNGIDFYRVFLHEALHGHGLGHKPTNVREPALIAPTYDTRLRNLQEADKAELVRRYGPRQKPSPTAPVPAPTGDKWRITTPNGEAFEGSMSKVG